MIIFNAVGLLEVFLTVPVTLLCWYFAPKFKSELISLPIVIVFDLVYRWIKGDKQFFSPNKGGHFFYIPTWILMLISFLVSIFSK